MNDLQAVQAAWVIVDGKEPPLSNATVVFQDGVIQEVTQKNVPEAIDAGNSVLLPALVNAHTHLEFSQCSEPLEVSSPFTAWIKSLMQSRNSRASVASSLQQGIKESKAAGVGVMGEIATWEIEHAHIFDERVFTGIAFKESLGILKEQVQDRFQQVRNWVDGILEKTVAVKMGISPHAPYSVHPELFQKLVKLAEEMKMPMAMHLAETQSELELLANQRGEFREFLESLGLWNQESFSYGMQIRDFLEGLSKAPRGLVVHGNYLLEEDLKFIKQHENLTVVYCPRTHAYFGHENHPWMRMQELGIRVALGTDSRASNPDLSIWREVQFLYQKNKNIEPGKLLEMATMNGAFGLMREQSSGKIAAGYDAKFAVAHSDQEIREPWDFLLDPMTEVTGFQLD